VYIVEDAVIGRDGEHRRLVIADEHGTQKTVLWWQGAGQGLPEGHFDLAYGLRARDYRGEMQLQVEWVDARPRSAPSLLSSASERVVVDSRKEADPLVALVSLPQTETVIWAEGMDPGTSETIGSADRLGLHPARVLAIWTAPPGPAELARAVQTVKPDEVHLFAFEPEAVEFRPFVQRLAGMLKYDLELREGQVNIQRLAAALGHREVTIRVGLEWLVARGQLRIVETGEHTLTIQAGGGSSFDTQEVQSRLRRLLEETTAYRRFFCSAPPEKLGILE
jgi:single-stranded-DNA-specific exonuclease